ncbi:hypothetical protein LCGC14_1066190 [marine sediment metagenome]|uniref:HTH araC/xylS-type domain-containing protein n=1 Tax=marine sediment metagenome TaxID=412755 RepID=A0A0F9MPD6_9ZZZZ
MVLTYEKMLEATLNRNAAYDGELFVGVRTTKIYCLPSCKAKKPFIKNIIFFKTREEAITAEFRGCKRCKSEFFPHIAPEWLEPVMTYIKKSKHTKINEIKRAKVAGVNITTIRRYFKSHFQITPIAYYRRLRLTNVKKMIVEGKNCSIASYRSGFKSISGFRDVFIKEHGSPPGKFCTNR